MPASREDWGRTGPMLAARRVQIAARYANRRLFADETGVNWRLLYDAERGRRATFRPETVRALEVAYRLEPGSLDGTLAGGPLKPLPAPSVVTAPVPPPRPAEPGAPPVSESFFTEHVLPSQDQYDRQVLEAVMRLCDGEGRLLPWPARWEYISVVLTLRHGRNGQEAGLIPPVVESELLLNPHAREIARHAHQIRRKPCGPPLSAVPMDTECDCFTPVASRGGWGVPVKRPGGEQQCRR